MEEDAGVEEEESGRGCWHRGGGRSTTLASRRRRAEEDTDVKDEESRFHGKRDIFNTIKKLQPEICLRGTRWTRTTTTFLRGRARTARVMAWILRTARIMAWILRTARWPHHRNRHSLDRMPDAEVR